MASNRWIAERLATGAPDSVSRPTGNARRDRALNRDLKRNFDQDTYGELVIVRMEAIPKEFESRLDGGWMLWVGRSRLPRSRGK